MVKNRLIFLLAAAVLVLVLCLAGCKSEEKTSAPAATAKPAATTTAASVAKPAATTAPLATSKPAVTTTAAAKPSSGASGAMDKVLQDLKENYSKIGSMKFDMVMSDGMMVSKMYQKGKKSRMETNMMGSDMIVITDGDKQVSYMWMVDENKAMMTDMEEDTPAASQTSIEDLWDADLVYEGTEVLDGKTCSVVEYSQITAQGKMTGKVWIWQEKGVPLRMETGISGAAQQGMNMNIVIDFENYEFTDLPDSLFELPPDVEIVDQVFPFAMPTDMPTDLPTNFPTNLPTNLPD
ncbi:MAG: outer membrane lipoprotein carrier protein LolA [Dehalococcoidales bacterium]|nr:outer membrane lipoprotein carrier protein LolA [Dehalococcoidales bacterium]